MWTRIQALELRLQEAEFRPAPRMAAPDPAAFADSRRPRAEPWWEIGPIQAPDPVAATEPERKPEPLAEPELAAETELAAPPAPEPTPEHGPEHAGEPE